MPPSAPRSEQPLHPARPTARPPAPPILMSPAPRHPPHFFLFRLSHSASANVSVAPRFADHLHKFHENDKGVAAGDLWQ